MSVRLPKTLLIADLVFTALAALSCLGQAGEASPNLKQADTDYRAGVAALSHNDLNTALADFEKVVRLAPAAEQGHSALGAVLVRLERTREGIRELEKALAIQPSDSSAQLNLALAYEQSGQEAKALPWFAKLEAASRVDKHELPANVLSAYARALAAAQQFSAAATHMNDTIARDPQSAEWWDELGSICAQHQDWSNAEQAFTSALQLNPDLA